LNLLPFTLNSREAAAKGLPVSVRFELGFFILSTLRVASRLSGQAGGLPHGPLLLAR